MCSERYVHREVAVAKMYERVKLVRPIHVDFTGALVEAGTEATVIDLLDDDAVLIEFDEDEAQATIAKVYDIVPVS